MLIARLVMYLPSIPAFVLAATSLSSSSLFFSAARVKRHLGLIDSIDSSPAPQLYLLALRVLLLCRSGLEAPECCQDPL